VENKIIKIAILQWRNWTKAKRIPWAVTDYMYFQDDEPGSSGTIFIMLRVRQPDIPG
jgi:hypothetical protein